MNAGLPGAGIGGLFYLASALMMPIRQLLRRLVGRERPGNGWAVALSQAAIALAILASMGLAGWGATWLVRRPWTRHVVSAATLGGLQHSRPLAVLGLALSTGSLLAVLLLVEVLRLALRPGRKKASEDDEVGPGRRSRAAAAAIVLLTLAALLCDVEPLVAQMSAPLNDLPAAAGDSLSRDAARTLAAVGRTDAAIRAYEQWVATHPDDAVAWRELGRQRQRAGRLSAAAGALERSLELQPDKGTRNRLQAIRVALRPTAEPLVGGSTDSDATRRWLAGLAADAAVARGRVGVRATHTSSRDPSWSGAAIADQLQATLRVRPLAAVDLDLAAGAARVDAPVTTYLPMGAPTGGSMGNGGGNGKGNGNGTANGSASAGGIPVTTAADVPYFGPAARLRLRIRPAPHAPALDLRASSAPVDASAALLAAHVWRDEVSGTLELPVGPFRLRGTGKAGQLRLQGETNQRRSYAAALAIPASSAVELSAQFSHFGYAKPAQGPYFAPRLAETADVGAYVETDLGDAVSLAADLGGGMARLGRFDEPNGAWGPALRLWSMLAWTVAPGRQLRIEGEAYDTRAGEVLGSTSALSWRYASITTSLRISIP